jgi:hypothetical protein
MPTCRPVGKSSSSGSRRGLCVVPTTTRTIEVRTSPLTVDEIEDFSSRGFARVGRAFGDADVGTARAALERARMSGLEYDLLDPDHWKDWPAGEPRPAKPVATMFNLWLVDPELRAITFNPTLARWAAQLLGCRQVRVLEDNSLYKEPGNGGELRWHQDYSYYPLAQMPSVTAWIALDRVHRENGAVQVAVGSHLLGERLPVTFGGGIAYLEDKRPSVVKPIELPDDVGLQVEVLELQPGEVTFHHSLTWHSSAPNTSSEPRRAFAIRYFPDGAIWLGSRRCNFYYTDEQVGLEPGEPAGGKYFPLVPF